MTKNIIITILAVLSLTGILYGVCTSSNLEYARELHSIDEQIMELQYKIDLEQASYTSCEQILAETHSNAEQYRTEIEQLNKQKAQLVGLEME